MSSNIASAADCTKESLPHTLSDVVRHFWRVYGNYTGFRACGKQNCCHMFPASIAGSSFYARQTDIRIAMQKDKSSCYLVFVDELDHRHNVGSDLGVEKDVVVRHFTQDNGLG